MPLVIEYYLNQTRDLDFISLTSGCCDLYFLFYRGAKKIQANAFAKVTISLQKILHRVLWIIDPDAQSKDLSSIVQNIVY